MPLTPRYATLGFYAQDEQGGGDARVLVQDARPLTPASVQRYELALDIVGLDGAFEITWPEMTGFSDEWRLELRDRQSGAVVDLQADTSYAFTSGGRAAVASALASGTVRPQRASDTEGRFQIAVVPAGVVVTSGDLFDVPSEARLDAAAPNPFRERTEIRFALPASQQVRLTVYDALGRQVAVLADRAFPSGAHRVPWEARALPSGVYFVRLHTDAGVLTRSLTLLR